MVTTVRPGRAEDAAAVSEMMQRSKAHWGYHADFLAACRAELTVSPERCAEPGSTVVLDDDTVIGFAALGGSAPDGELDFLYVAPEAMGGNLGRLLLAESCRKGAARGARRLFIDADPHAESFYLRLGAVRVGESPSGSVAGRMLPRLVVACDVDLAVTGSADGSCGPD